MNTKLIEEYKTLTENCSSTDYEDKISVKSHNKAVDRMYEIVETIIAENSNELVQQFTELLDISDNKTNLWCAIQMLERLKPDNQTEKKALDIIKSATKDESAEALGYQFWLNDWYDKNKK